ncbi:hypothetical protein HWV62_26552 [Athelia sp. TMB]|nr:hypothetical protein HWV62_26552 [Athelia sp. TMB]
MPTILPSWTYTIPVDDPAAGFVVILTAVLLGAFALSRQSPSPQKNLPTYYLPKTLRNWPWKSIISPHYAAAQAESVAWLESFHPFNSKVQASFNKADFNNLRSCCDLMHTLFVLDDYTDLLDGPGARALCNATLDAIMNPDKARPEGESIIGEIARQFWKHASVTAPKACQERFVNTLRTNLDSIVVQAERRSSSYICTIDEYMAARRENIGTSPVFAFIEISKELDLPHHVMQHPAIVSLIKDATDMILLTNDMCSYKKEVLRNDADYNIVTVVMVNKKTDLNGAVQWISDSHDEIVGRFLSTREDLLSLCNGESSWGREIDLQVIAYVDGLGLFVVLVPLSPLKLIDLQDLVIGFCIHIQGFLLPLSRNKPQHASLFGIRPRPMCLARNVKAPSGGAALQYASSRYVSAYSTTPTRFSPAYIGENLYVLFNLLSTLTILRWNVPCMKHEPHKAL